MKEQEMPGYIRSACARSSRGSRLEGRALPPRGLPSIISANSLVCINWWMKLQIVFKQLSTLSIKAYCTHIKCNSPSCEGFPAEKETAEGGLYFLQGYLKGKRQSNMAYRDRQWRKELRASVRRFWVQ